MNDGENMHVPNIVHPIVHSAAAGAAFFENRNATDFIVSTDAPAPEQKKRGRRRKEPISKEEQREKEREKKARWRAKKKERDNQSFQIEIPYDYMSKEVWRKIREHLAMDSNGMSCTGHNTADNDARSFLYILNMIGYEWDNEDGMITRAPPLRDYEKLRQLEAPDEFEPHVDT